MAKKSRKDIAAEAEAAKVQQTTEDVPNPAPEVQSRWSLIYDIRLRRAIYLVLLAATYAPLSQLNLSPVYGAIPSAVYHRRGIIIVALLAFGIGGYIPASLERWFAGYVFWVPLIQFFLFKYSSLLGNPLGPLITESLTLYPIIVLSMHFANQQLAGLDLGFLSDSLKDTAPPMFNYTLFILLVRLNKSQIPGWMGTSKIFSRLGLQTVLAVTYAAMIPTTTFWPAFPALAFNTLINTHVPLQKTTEVLSDTLAIHNYTMLDRHEAKTGYISVLENNVDKFRVMRHDHSLLGGQWLMEADSQNKRIVPEPIFAAFTMLEAVRLIERDGPERVEQEQALNIGLGVGTVPAALHAHGIYTTIIELDPVVHHYALKHFNLPTNNHVFLGDAAAILEAQEAEFSEHFDYVVHDVFAGGAEPASLFTTEFLESLKSTIKPNGAIAINYGGDLNLPATSMVYRTIMHVFPSCRVFREDENVSAAERGGLLVKDEAKHSQFTNLVFLCNRENKPVRFRKAVEADFLGTASRRAYMVPKHEVRPSTFQEEGELLSAGNVKTLEKAQVQSAINHWKLMRNLMPAEVWENW